MLTTHLHHNAQDLMSELVGFQVRRDLIVGEGYVGPPWSVQDEKKEPNWERQRKLRACAWRAGKEKKTMLCWRSTSKPAQLMQRVISLCRLALGSLHYQDERNWLITRMIHQYQACEKKGIATRRRNWLITRMIHQYHACEKKGIATRRRNWLITDDPPVPCMREEWNCEGEGERKQFSRKRNKRV